MLNYNTISLEENVQYIYLSIFIMLFIVIILFYLKETNRKHYKLFEKYGETRGGTQIYSKQQLKLDPTPLFYPSKDATVTLRPCEIRFNKNGSSKYIFKDGWKEIATINNTVENSVDLPYAKKILTKEGANKSDFNNFSEESRCFKLKNDNNDSIDSIDIIDSILETNIEIDKKHLEDIKEVVNTSEALEELEPIDIIVETETEKEDNISLDLDFEDLNEDIEENPDELKEVNNLDLSLENTLETMQLKKPNQVYFELYKEARNKAKVAKKNALLAYLEAKNIKKTYMIENMNDSDSEIDAEIDDVSESELEGL